jgi:hypothetical protein
MRLDNATKLNRKSEGSPSNALAVRAREGLLKPASFSVE